MVNNGHELFTVTSISAPPGHSYMQVVCACGESSPFGEVGHIVRWFGSHCYTAALDRAIEILKS